MTILADFKELEEELDAECARELAGAFLEDSANELAAIDAAIASQDASELKAHAHGLKGCCRTIKAPRAEQLATDLEMAAIDKNWPTVETIRPNLQAAYDELCDFVLEYLAAAG